MMTTDQSGCSAGYVGVNSGIPQVNLFQDNSDSTEWNEGCNYTSTFNGTSSAAPLVSGTVALMLEANPNLTWRDVKHILATTAKKIYAADGYMTVDSFELQGITQYEWTTNAAGYKFHPWYGFGRLDADAAVNEAKTYTANSLGTFVTSGYENSTVNATFIDLGATTHSISVSAPSGSNNNVEFVRISVNLDHEVPYSVGIRLQSPEGTLINLLPPYSNVVGNPKDYYFELGANALW